MERLRFLGGVASKAPSLFVTHLRGSTVNDLLLPGIQADSVQEEKALLKYTGWPRKNETGYFPQYLDAITDQYKCMRQLLMRKMIPRSAILVQQFVFWGTFCEAMLRPKIFPFQLKLGLNKCYFGSP